MFYMAHFENGELNASKISKVCFCVQWDMKRNDAQVLLLLCTMGCEKE